MRRVFESVPRRVDHQAVRSGSASGGPHDGRRKDPGLRDPVESDGIVSAAEFERSFGMSGRSEDVLDLSSFRQGVEERRTHRAAGRARSVARRSLSRIAGLLSRPVGSPPLSRSALVRSPPSANACAALIAAHGRRASGRSRSKIANAGRAHHRVAGDLSEFGPSEFDCRGVVRHGVILLYEGRRLNETPVSRSARVHQWPSGPWLG